MAKIFKTSGSVAVQSKVCIEGLPIPINIDSIVNQFTPDLTVLPKCSAYIMEWIKKSPVINTEYYKSKEMVDIADYKLDMSLPHKFTVVLNNRKKAIITIDRTYIYIKYQRGRLLELQFNNRLDARTYWDGLKPKLDITDKVKEYLKPYPLTYLKGI